MWGGRGGFCGEKGERETVEKHKGCWDGEKSFEHRTKALFVVVTFTHVFKAHHFGTCLSTYLGVMYTHLTFLKHLPSVNGVTEFGR